VPSKTCQLLGASVPASLTVFRPLWSRRQQFWSSSRLLCGFASTKGLSTEARNWHRDRTCHSELASRRIRFLLTTLQPGVNVQLTNILVPPLSLCIPKLRTPHEDRDRCRPGQHFRPISCEPRCTCSCTCPWYERNHGCPTVRRGSTFMRCEDLIVSFSRGGPRRGRGRGPRRRNERPNKSAADLDAEMEVRRFRLACCCFTCSHPFTRITPLRVPLLLPLLTLLQQLNRLVHFFSFECFHCYCIMFLIRQLLFPMQSTHF
jgi:hypothetical protein